jgi:hypothetical protein
VLHRPGVDASERTEREGPVEDTCCVSGTDDPDHAGRELAAHRSGQLEREKLSFYQKGIRERGSGAPLPATCQPRMNTPAPAPGARSSPRERPG